MRLLMIADDFTGALDAGVQFAKKGFATCVRVYAENEMASVPQETDVLVIDAETRHRTPEDAYRIVYNITKYAVASQVPYLFKKTDSALRGNVGAELTAVLDAADEKVISFIPAFPRLNRVTLEGRHYIDGVPVNKSVFGTDPFEPVMSNSIPDLIHNQCGTNVRVQRTGNVLTDVEQKTIAVYDCTNDEQLERLTQQLHDKGAFHLLAGCAGLAEYVPEIMGWKGKQTELPKLSDKFLVICGSVNPITVRQLEYAQKQGFLRIQLTPDQTLSENYFTSLEGRRFLKQIWETQQKTDRMIIDTNDFKDSNATEAYAEAHNISWDEVRVRIAAALGTVGNYMMDRGMDASVLMTGGDTLLGCIRNMDQAELTPVGEFETGIVLSKLMSIGNTTYVFTKSGGFGDEGLLVSMADKICKEKYNSLGCYIEA